MKRFLMAGLLFAAVFALPTQADFFQCVALVVCNGSGNADVMNGSIGNDIIDGGPDNDIILGGDGEDVIDGDDDDDILFGGQKSDAIAGGPGNDKIFPGPDQPEIFQGSNGEDGDDSFYVFAGETVNCQTIEGEDGFDVLHLVGFSPFIADFPFGVENLAVKGELSIVVQDPITGGYIIIEVGNNLGSSIERITGMPPIVAVLDDVLTFLLDNCTTL